MLSPDVCAFIFFLLRLAAYWQANLLAVVHVVKTSLVVGHNDKFTHVFVAEELLDARGARSMGEEYFGRPALLGNVLDNPVGFEESRRVHTQKKLGLISSTCKEPLDTCHVLKQLCDKLTGASIVHRYAVVPFSHVEGLPIWVTRHSGDETDRLVDFLIHTILTA